MFHVFQGSLVAFGAFALAFVMRRVPAVLLNVIKTKRQQTKTKCIRCSSLNTYMRMRNSSDTMYK